jgi:hypothetical protein
VIVSTLAACWSYAKAALLCNRGYELAVHRLDKCGPEKAGTLGSIKPPKQMADWSWSPKVGSCQVQS